LSPTKTFPRQPAPSLLGDKTPPPPILGGRPKKPPRFLPANEKKNGGGGFKAPPTQIKKRAKILCFFWARPLKPNPGRPFFPPGALFGGKKPFFFFYPHGPLFFGPKGPPPNLKTKENPPFFGGVKPAGEKLGRGLSKPPSKNPFP